MSIILDALRRGRAGRAPAPAHAAHADAVLQTLGSRAPDGRNPPGPTGGLVAAGIVLAMVLLFTVVWLMNRV